MLWLTTRYRLCGFRNRGDISIVIYKTNFLKPANTYISDHFLALGFSFTHDF